MRIKVFGPYKDDLHALEVDVQRWLDEHPQFEIKHIAQAQQGQWHIVLTILYDEPASRSEA
jgi:hypothetical protein